MSEAELNVLERDVEQARARFAGDLARLRSPATLSNFQDDLWAQASETKDDLVEKAKEAATDGVQRLVSDLKEKAAANPAAALAIAAGLAWRLVHRPPIASLLVGIGLFSLWRTTPSEGEGLVPRAADLAGQVKETLQEWSAGATENLTQIADKASVAAEEAYASARDTVSKVKTHVTVAADQAAGSVQETMTHIRDQASAAGAKTSAAVRAITPNAEARDNLLLGAAALAVAAAVGIAYQRRSADETK
jgi:polyhydroxyalkanoate synthesis regulator phasin